MAWIQQAAVLVHIDDDSSIVLFLLQTSLMADKDYNRDKDKNRDTICDRDVDKIGTKIEFMIAKEIKT